MSFLDFLKRGKKPEHVSPNGNSIQPEWKSSWAADDIGLTETRRHVGKSAEGFHPGVEETFKAGAGQIVWGEAHATPERAKEAAWELEAKRREAIEDAHERSPEMPKRMKALFKEWREDYGLAKQRDETGQEPKAPVPETRPAAKSVQVKKQPMREKPRSHDIPF